MTSPSETNDRAPLRPASLDAADDQRLIVDLIGPAAASRVQHVPVATLFDMASCEHARLGLAPSAQRRLLAAVELARRFQPTARPPRPHERPRELLPHLSGLRAQPVETLGLLLLDSRCALIDGFRSIAGGALMHVSVQPREVFADAVAHRAAAVVLAHNHPSGDPSPSLDDRAFTQAMVQAGALLGIRLLDHLIVSRRAYFSFSEARLL